MAGYSVLNLGAGKTLYPMDTTPQQIKNELFMVNLDPMYYNASPASVVETEHQIWLENGSNYGTMNKLDDEAMPLMERYALQFDQIVMYRYLEHVARHDLMYFIYLLSTSLKIGGTVDVVVPNYEKLAQRVLSEDTTDPKFDRDDIITTTELLNEPSCPHASVWTPDRAKHYFEYEGRFIVDSKDIDPDFGFDGRNIYMRFKATRSK